MLYKKSNDFRYCVTKDDGPALEHAVHDLTNPKIQCPDDGAVGGGGRGIRSATLKPS